MIYTLRKRHGNSIMLYTPCVVCQHSREWEGGPAHEGHSRAGQMLRGYGACTGTIPKHQNIMAFTHTHSILIFNSLLFCVVFSHDEESRLYKDFYYCNSLNVQ